MTTTKRKTVPVNAIREQVNDMLAHSAKNGQPPEARVGLYVLLEAVLLESGNYKGYRYTDGSNGDLDHTRRFYY